MLLTHLILHLTLALSTCTAASRRHKRGCSPQGVLKPSNNTDTHPAPKQQHHSSGQHGVALPADSGSLSASDRTEGGQLASNKLAAGQQGGSSGGDAGGNPGGSSSSAPPSAPTGGSSSAPPSAPTGGSSSIPSSGPSSAAPNPSPSPSSGGGSGGDPGASSGGGGGMKASFTQ